MSPSALPIAVRAHILPPARPERKHRDREQPPRWGSSVLVFDTETTADPSQALLLGSYRLAEWNDDGTLRTTEEGLFHADDLPTRDPAGFKALKAYQRRERQDIASEGTAPRLRLIKRATFVEDVLWPAAQAQALIVGFNLPFDLSRLALRWGSARRRWEGDKYGGGFSLALWPGEHRPRLCIRHVTPTLTWIGFRHDRQFGGSFAGLFLDLSILVRALTDKKCALERACKILEVEHGKLEAEEHGVITRDYITYNRRDTQATTELLEKVRAEYDRHPVDLEPTRAFSAASIAKAYLRKARMSPLRTREPAVPPERLGQAMVAYYGGRSECRIRRHAVPVVYCDVLSMYPTVQALLGLRDWLAAESLTVVDCTTEAQALLNRCTPDQALQKAFWRRLTFFAEIEPKDAIVPVRAQYRGGSDAFNIGVNPLTLKSPLWYAGPALVAARLLSGRPLRVRQAWRLEPRGLLTGLQPIKVRGQLRVDPRSQDFFRTVIELRKSKASQRDDRLSDFLKVLANSGSYGINVQVDVTDAPEGQPQSVEVYGPSRPFRQDCTMLEQPGDFYFPPVASLITASAQLILALLETEVRCRRGTWAFCDTDSMAIVATPKGGLLECPAGLERLHGSPAIRALSFAQVRAIQRRLERLKPYDRRKVKEPLLKFEDENFVDDQLVGVECFGIAAKRYVLFRRGVDGQPIIIKASEHGLGHLLDPRDAPPKDGPKWIDELWHLILGRALGLPHTEPAWLDRPAVTRFGVTAPRELAPAKRGLSGLRPFNFALAGHVAAFGHPAGVDPTHFQVIHGYSKDPAEWLEGPWIDRYTGKGYCVSTDPTESRPDLVHLKSYRALLEAYERHPEAKSIGPNGEPCGPLTSGLLQRRPVVADRVVVIGKEGHRTEEVTDGLIQDWAAVRQIYSNPAEDPWLTVVVPFARLIPKQRLALVVGVSPRTIQSLRNHGTRPSQATLVAMMRALVSEARRSLRLRRCPNSQRQLAEGMIGLTNPRENLTQSR